MAPAPPTAGVLLQGFPRGGDVDARADDHVVECFGGSAIAEGELFPQLFCIASPSATSTCM